MLGVGLCVFYPFDIGSIYCTHTNGTRCSIHWIAIIIPSTYKYPVSLGNIRTFYDSMNFCMQKLFIWFTYNSSMICLNGVGFDIGILSYTQNATTTVINDRRDMLVYSFTQRILPSTIPLRKSLKVPLNRRR